MIRPIFLPKKQKQTERKMLKNNKSFELLEQYLSYFTVIKGRSINTVIEYRIDVLMFFEFLCNKLNMEREKYDLSMIDYEFVGSITFNDMYAIISHCQTENKASAGTRAKKIVSIRQFWKYLKNKTRVIDNNVAEDLETPKIPKHIAKYLTLEESVRLF